MKNLLCITAHPDDDTLFAGTLLKLKKPHWKLYKMILTSSESGVSLKDGVKDLKKHRENEGEVFAKRIGIEKTFWAKREDGFLKKDKKIIKDVVKTIRTIKPNIVILLNPNDYHKDHRESYLIGVEAIEMSTRNSYLVWGKK
jgi:LmbE family N-acetylglucosaminyl deacetylase